MALGAGLGGIAPKWKAAIYFKNKIKRVQNTVPVRNKQNKSFTCVLNETQTGENRSVKRKVHKKTALTLYIAYISKRMDVRYRKVPKHEK